jgi:hypothetical protein
MKISELRALVIGGVTAGRPNTDFPLPFEAVDFLIYQQAASAFLEYQVQFKGVMPIEPWMLAEFTCLTSVLDTPVCFSEDCESRYRIDLPFIPLQLLDNEGIFSVMLQKKRQAIRMLKPGQVAHIKYLEIPVNRDRPAAYNIGEYLYLLGGDRDFSKTYVQITGIVGQPLRNISGCIADDTSVPVPPGMAVSVIRNTQIEVMKMLATYGDVSEDGRLTPEQHVDTR